MEGLAVLFVAVLAWPVVVAVCTLLARKRRRLAAFIFSLALFPVSVFAIVSTSQTSTRGAFVFTVVSIALLWAVVIAAMALAAFERKRAQCDAGPNRGADHSLP